MCCSAGAHITFPAASALFEATSGSFVANALEAAIATPPHAWLRSPFAIGAVLAVTLLWVAGVVSSLVLGHMCWNEAAQPLDIGDYATADNCVMWERHGEWLLAGPRASKLQAWHLRVTKSPFYILFPVYVLLEQTPFYLGSIWARMSTGSWIPRCLTHRELPATWVFRFLTRTPLLMASMIDASGELLTLLVPDNVLVATEGRFPKDRVAGLRVVVNIQQQSVASQDLRGVPIDDHELKTLLFLAAIFWAHVKTHKSAEQSAREIWHKSVTALEPSTRHVVGLHDALLYHKISPSRVVCFSYRHAPSFSWSVKLFARTHVFARGR